MPFAGTPTTLSSPCWRVLGFACRKQSISVFRTSPQTAWSFAVQSSAKAVLFLFTRPPRQAWNSTSRRRRAYTRHSMITCSFLCEGAVCCCTMPKPHFTTSSRRSACLVEPGLPRPTIHSLRHTFAVRALETCPDGRDRITKHMVALSTYLGHSKVADTYWYLEATPDLMRNIADSCQSFFTGGRP